MTQDYDHIQEGKIDRTGAPGQMTARQNHIFSLRCPECSWGVMATKRVRCGMCGEVTEIEGEWLAADEFTKEQGG